MKENRTVLSILAHPDDAELQCAGTLALLAKKGWNVVLASMTPGQAGSMILGPEEISAIRRVEAMNSASILGGSYYCMESEDIFVMYDKPTIQKVTKLIRTVRPSIVITASPSDYIVDHEITSQITQTACLAAGIPNIKIPGTTPNNFMPSLYYCDPTAGKDKFGNKINSTIMVDIGSTISIKEKMLCCHKSQRDWLMNISKVDEFVLMMKDFSEEKGNEINCSYAEGFRQHLGFSYPTENILKTELKDLVHI